MSDLSSAIAEVRSELNISSPDIFTDLCDIQSVTSGSDDYGGASQTPGTVAANVPCKYEALSSSEQSFAGGTTASLTHRITMGVTPSSLAIKQNQRIRVLANGDVPELMFENPIPQLGSFSPFIDVLASLRML